MCISVSSHAPGARDSGDSAQSHLPAQLRGWRIKLRSSRLEFVFSCQSCELVCRAGVSPAEYGRMGNRSGCPTAQTRKFASKRAPAEREREGSAAKSIQRMSVLWAVRCRGTTAPAWYASMQRTRIHRRKERQRKILRHRAPSFSLTQEQLRVRSCSIGSRVAEAQAWPARNEMGKRLVFRRLDLRSRQTRSDWKLPATSRSRSQRSCNARSFSRWVQSLTGGESQMFSCGGSINGATVLAAMPFGGMVLSIPLGVGLAWSNCGCSTRVANSIAVNSNAAAR